MPRVERQTRIRRSVRAQELRNLGRAFSIRWIQPLTRAKNVETVSTMVPPLTATFCTPQLINGSAQGSAQNEHVGRKAIMKKVQLRYIYNSGSAGGQQSQVRILIVYDKQANGALPSVGDVLASSATYNSFMNLANSDRFVVLCDEICDSTQSSQLNMSGSRYIKCNLRRSLRHRLHCVLHQQRQHIYYGRE